jgi:type VI secretion system protein ImpD
VQSARQYDSATATANARISTMLQYMLCVGRFAHYVKVIARDRVGSFSTPEQCEDYLTKWLREYCNGNSNPSPELMARCPLRQARVQVSEPPGRPGSYQCVIHLRPHSQVDQIVSEFKLVTELAPRAA